jgi:hypothetical protein
MARRKKVLSNVYKQAYLSLILRHVQIDMFEVYVYGILYAVYLS